jgi:His/Glu/Gln/Arg/opine family amino acid ABC transporter permease subunit
MAYNWNWELAFRYLPMFGGGLLLGLAMALFSLLFGSAVGLGTAALSLRPSRTLRYLVRAYVEVFRNVPLLLWTYFAFYGLPYMGITFLNNFWSFIAALSIYAGAYLAEIFRGGLTSIPTRYAETGRAMGLTSWQRIRLITLPLMFRIVLPSLTNAFISLFKDTSIAAALAVTEITYTAQHVNIETFHVLEAWSIASVIYLVVGYALAFGFRGFERRYRLVG